ncbi:MAG: hypothetical protein GY862_18205, partial [Gammaproteobacteria bacterium]|nr:hypothetical protein [Gammaproteobacteria bacterium]
MSKPATLLHLSDIQFGIHHRFGADTKSLNADTLLELLHEDLHLEQDIRFTEETPWTFFEIPDLRIAVAGLNSTMRESHREEDHYGEVGKTQLQWFAERLEEYKRRGWFRIGA